MTTQIFQEPSFSAQSLAEKIRQLPPEKVREVAEFVEFLLQRQNAQYQSEATDRQLTQAAMRLSADAFAKVWDNPEDAVYDTL